MKNVWRSGFVVAVVLLLVVSLYQNRHGGLVSSGQEAPSFSLHKLGGGQLSSTDLRGKVVMVDFWATWCPPCVEEMPFLAKVAQEYQNKGLAFVAVSQDDPEDRPQVALFAERVPGLHPFVAFTNDATARAFKVQALPTLYFIDRDGKILDARRGSVSEGWVRSQIEKYLAAPEKK